MPLAVPLRSTPASATRARRPPSTAAERAQRALAAQGPPGCMALERVTVEGYSLELREGERLLGDAASRTAFRHMLEAWRRLFAAMAGRDLFGRRPTRRLSRHQLDALWRQDGPAAQAIAAACEDYALQLAHVVQRFRGHSTWRGVERVIIGGGFHQSVVGGRAIARAAELLERQKSPLQLETLHHHADEGGLIGWAHLAPRALLQSFDAILAVDLGGTNVRCGIVQTHLHRAPDLSRAEVVRRERWAHADDAPSRERLLQGIADMLGEMAAHAERKKIRLAPFVGVACPGLVSEEGRFLGGTQNLPGDWEGGRFHLAQDLCRRLPHLGGGRTQVAVHNDAVVQGLSQLPFIQDVRRWAILTVGTGLGNASFTNRSAASAGR